MHEHFFPARLFCVSKGKECPGSDLSATFAGTDRQCTIRCAQNVECMSAFWDAEKICHLRSNRCTTAQLQTASGTDFYRLSKLPFLFFSEIRVMCVEHIGADTALPSRRDLAWIMILLCISCTLTTFFPLCLFTEEEESCPANRPQYSKSDFNRL